MVLGEQNRPRRAGWIAAALLAAAAAGGAAAAEPAWLALCSRCLSPTVIDSSGLGTANATATARITRDGATAWCENWQPDGVAACVREQMAGDDARRVFRASADCTSGRITAIDGVTYRQAGVWTSDVGRGRTRWRDPSGKVVGQDNASGGLGIAQQWEVLCPRKPAQPATARPGVKQAVPAGAFVVGQQVEAKYGRDWVRGHVVRILPRAAPRRAGSRPMTSGW